jgi:hypothetical protein
VQDEAVTEQINKVIGTMDFSALEGRVGEVADGILKGIDSLRTPQAMAASPMGETSSSAQVQ